MDLSMDSYARMGLTIALIKMMVTVVMEEMAGMGEMRHLSLNLTFQKQAMYLTMLMIKSVVTTLLIRKTPT